MKHDKSTTLSTAFPEIGAGGYTRADGSIEFYSRVQALLDPEMRVLDFGAGRAEWFEDDRCSYRRRTRQLLGKAKEVVACDVDEAVLANRAADRTVVLTDVSTLPFADNSFDLIVADYVFEHVQDPVGIAAELTRVLAPGGWLCARTPNAYGYVALASRLATNRFHVPLLKAVQPHRKAMDVFPTVYKLNTLAAVRRFFPSALFDNFTYRYTAEPAYFFDKAAVLKMLRVIDWLLPPQCASQLFIFLRSRKHSPTPEP